MPPNDLTHTRQIEAPCQQCCDQRLQGQRRRPCAGDVKPSIYHANTFPPRRLPLLSHPIEIPQLQQPMPQEKLREEAKVLLRPLPRSLVEILSPNWRVDTSLGKEPYQAQRSIKIHGGMQSIHCRTYKGRRWMIRECFSQWLFG